MFEHRLGLALHKSLAEVRALPYPEFLRWQQFYMLEPWGWPNNEYYISAVLTMLYNSNRGKGKARDAKDFQRNMLSVALKALAEQPDIAQMPREEIIKQIKKDFGIP